MGVEYWADPKAIAAFLPDGLTPDPVSNGHAMIVFLDMQFTARNEEYLDPARYQFREALVLIDARWGDVPVTFCPLIFVDNEAAMARGWIQGFPKRRGSIFQTRTFAAPSPAMAPVAAGGRFGASLSSHGLRLAEARITLEARVEDPLAIFDRPIVLLRCVPPLEKGELATPAVIELAVMRMEKLQVVDMWAGDAELNLPEALGEELHSLAPIRVGSGFRSGLAFSVTDLRSLQEFTT